MTDERWIVVRHWERFQHYGDRDAVWVKVYVELNSNDEWLALSTAARGMLVTIWMEYARSRGHLRVGKAMQLCGKSARSSHLEALTQAGFVSISASKPLALARSRELPYGSKKKNARVPAREQSKSTKPRKGVTGWRIVRGSHGMTTIPDPNGTDPAPTIGRTL